jgi:hypothetical protein
MSQSPSPEVEAAIQEPSPERRGDLVGVLVVKARSASLKLNTGDAGALGKAQNDEAKRPVFDSGVYTKLWTLIQYAPHDDLIRKVALLKVDDPQSMCRGQAARYLLRNYPAERPALLAKLDNDPDARVHDAIAVELAPSDPSVAKKHWEQALSCHPLPHDLADSVPASLAYAAEKSDLPRYEAMDNAGGGRTIWGTVVAFMRRRFPAAPPSSPS